MPDHAIRRLQRTLIISILGPVILILLVVVAFFYLRSTNNAAAARRANMANQSLCRSTNRARLNGNLHVRHPLRAIAHELAHILRESATRATSQHDRRRALQLADKFQDYANQASDLPLLKCNTG